MGTKRQPHERSPPGLDLVPASQRRRLSFSNSDLSDPRQLQALYERCLDQVLRGLHPVSRDTAIRLAAIQCFVQFGPYQEGMERSSIRAYNLLPKEYVHAREHEKNIAEQYRNLVFPDEVAARRKYCEICKNLPTYGMIFFEVKEPDGNKLVSRLFGVNKDCVMSVDRKTKIVRKSWPLEQLRRWAASPTIFTIDFGDYQDGYYSVRTLEGDKIKRLIAEFVDIILKKRQIVDPFGLEGDEGAIMIEDYVLRARSVPLSMVDVQNRLGSPLVEEEQYEVVPPQVPQQQPQQMPFEPRGPFGPLADLLPAEFPQAPLQQPIPPIAKGPPEMPLFDQQHVAMPVRQQPVPAPRQLPPILDQYDQLLPLQQPPVIAAPFSPQQVPVQKQPPLGRQPLPAASPPAFSASPPPAQPAASQSLPPSLVNSIHQQQQPLTSTASSAASISAFTSHEISYEICYKDGLANRYFQQHFQSTRNLQALGGTIDSSLRRVAECRSSLGTFITPEPLAMSVEERESAIQLGEDTIRHRAIVFLASTAQAIEWTSEYQRPGPKYGQAQVAISQAGDNLCELCVCVDELSALVGNAQFSQQMYSLVQSLCDAFTGFLAKLHPNIAEKRSTFLSSASLVGESAFVLLNALNREEGDALEDQQFYVALNEVIQAVANTTANLVLQAKSLPETPGEMSSEPLIQAATQVALYTSELIALARVLAAIMAHPACQKRVQAAVGRVRLATIELLEQSKQIAFGQFALTGSTDNYARMQRNALDTELALQQLVQQTQA